MLPDAQHPDGGMVGTAKPCKIKVHLCQRRAAFGLYKTFERTKFNHVHFQNGANTPRAATEILRVLRPGGTFCVMVYNRRSLLAAQAWSSLRGKVAVGLAGMAVLASFAFFFPILAAQPLTPDAWRSRIWFADCARPGAPTLQLPDDQINQGPPPGGWCWI